MEIDKIKKYLQVYLDDVIVPELNNELVGEDEEPINVSIHKINYGEANPNRINFFLDMDPDWSKGSFTNKINSDISSFFRVRTFNPDVEDDELKWHQDLKDRKVTILESNGWSFQMENELPNKLENAKQIFIPKFAWHRVLKGSGKLVVEIEEID